MNSHSDIQKLLSPYSGNDISSHDRTLVEEHLKSCPDCRSELADLQTTMKLLRTTPEIEPPPWLTSRIMANVREQRELKTSWFKRIFFPLHIKLPIEGLALLFVCMTGFYLSQRVDTELQQTVAEKVDKTVAVPPPVSTPQAPAKESVNTVPISPAKDLPKVYVPKTAEPYVAVGKPAVPPAFAPSPAAIRESADLSGVQDNRGMAESHKTASKAEALSLKSAAPVMNKQAARSDDKQPDVSEATDTANYAGTPPIAVTPTQLIIRLNMATSTDAFSLISGAVIRSGGTIIHEPTSTTNRIKARIPISRVDELFISLDKIGKIVERPQYTNRAGTAEVNIVW